MCLFNVHCAARLSFTRSPNAQLRKKVRKEEVTSILQGKEELKAEENTLQKSDENVMQSFKTIE